MRRRILVAALLLLLVVGVLQLRDRGPAVPAGAALVVPVQGAYVEAADAGLAARLASLLVEPPPSFTAFLSNLAKAERDPRIETVVLRIRNLDVRWAKAQEMRGAIERLREAGKHTVAYLEVQTYGGNLEYYVASAADEVVLAAGVPAPLTGLRAEYFFLGGLWERLGVELAVLGVGEYKSAVETIAGEKMSEAHREMAGSLLDAVEAQWVVGIASGRGLDEAAVRAAVDAAPLVPPAAVERGLVDRIAHWEEVFAVRGDPPRIEAAAYRAVPPDQVAFEPVARFGLVYGSGNVVQGDGRGHTPPVFASDAVVRALEQAAEDDSVRAILLRLDSPGGSGPAAEQMWAAVMRVRERKPVVATMSDLAASAAYYVASAADRIVALPGTYTGSIGVFVVRPSFGRLLDKLDVGHETLLRGDHADLLATLRPLSEETRRRFRIDVEASYAHFLERVAEGRGMGVEAVDRVARGRVWTGEQARARGLVDALGGLHAAVDVAGEMLGIAPDADVELVAFPAPRPLAQQIQEAMGVGARTAWSAQAAWPLLEPIATAASWVAGLPVGTPAWLPPVAIEIR